MATLDHAAEPVSDPGEDGAAICRHCGRRIFAAWTYVGQRPAWNSDGPRRLGEPDMRWRHAPVRPDPAESSEEETDG